MIDIGIVERAGGSARVLMVASGGCTAAALAACDAVAEIHIVDPNPAQVALARLKLSLVATVDPLDRQSLMGHSDRAAIASNETAIVRRDALRRHWETLGLPEDVIGPPEEIARIGPDHSGRYEMLFSALRRSLEAHERALHALLSLSDPREQARRASPGTELGLVLESAFEDVFSLPNLVALFGEAATQRRREPFARHFLQRLYGVLEKQPARVNPFLWQMLLGTFPPDAPHAWLVAPRPLAPPRVESTVGTMDEVLDARGRELDFVHLSNILDWLSPESARATLGRAWRALAPGGWVVIRQLNSTLEIPALEPRFEWLEEEGNRLLQADRSFFYRRLHVGRKP